MYVVRHFYPTKYCLVADSIERWIHKDYDVRAGCRIFRHARLFRKIFQEFFLLLQQCIPLVFLKFTDILRKTCASICKLIFSTNCWTPYPKRAFFIQVFAGDAKISSQRFSKPKRFGWEINSGKVGSRPLMRQGLLREDTENARVRPKFTQGSCSVKNSPVCRWGECEGCSDRYFGVFAVF